MRNRIATVAALICVAGHFLGAATECYVVKRDNSKVKGFSLKVESDGTLKLQIEQNGPTQSFKKGELLELDIRDRDTGEQFPPGGIKLTIGRDM